MNNFKLNKKLALSSALIIDLREIEVRLSHNALIPWILIIPKVDHTEWHELNLSMQNRLNALINDLACFLKYELKVDKINIATIGNVVSQLHIHVVGRKEGDFCWPDTIWGQTKFKAYDKTKQKKLIHGIKNHIQPHQSTYTITPFQQSVYDALMLIPAGKITTYKLLAQYLKCRSAQAIGQALKCNPYSPSVPCHRVVSSDLTIGGYSGKKDGGKIQQKIALLKAEGVIFNNLMVDPNCLFSF